MCSLLEKYRLWETSSSPISKIDFLVTFSEFNTSDYTEDMGSPEDDPDPPICYYRGYRNPPDHPTDPYDLSPQYWHVFAARLAFVVVFEVIYELMTKQIK